MLRPRILPLTLVAMLALLGVKLEGLGRGSAPSAALIAAAAASAPIPAPLSPASAPPPEMAAPSVTEALAERAILEALRARRAEIEAREAALAEREILAAAVERRLVGRLEELASLQQRLEAEARSRDERTEQGWRQMVRLYEGMRPREAAGIFDDLDMAVLIQVVDRMREAKAALVLAAMRPERARVVTIELARHRSRSSD